ncbi:helix-turn-helix transcriptional regulator [Bradyrhizobium viridifuturi]|uniref:helix-turn-helix domain-containing protein n=1 Tax=uncultured Bradyrhizobium sp. TaxID=199684 RepID=UPI001BABF3D8|nr:helix-turn-helix transcriptional regulator [uncultured Bradyrhizobium sp.]MBR1040589.1 helix-turn-helix transcriptional regulator [Bradyrhizobium viridifuturi]MBR1074877.1 helix-turn-helix transcriptional regulator [Bradyrhizobium viridifuturi]
MIGKKSGRKAAHAARGNTLLLAFQGALEGPRRDLGLSRRAFAERLGIPRSSYFHLMTEAANPSLDYIELIAERAGIEPTAFFGRVAIRRASQQRAAQGLRPIG